ncbi:hypothetical protein H6G74_09050 [Nostoc spongiaeforme FACHB-130]|uniref:TMhelix containing protein n=1 Tax=Nostoc spongiaeforme FACHB-130 TaxID=1357510 RepID=A0ABR8FVV3_9NOSO|nr:hypothetical protein [Nostoc spongiaeforme]MBD2594475.1 hypothetical protein [Nostoc spongiaeforme FACHB-130]
MKAKKLMAVVLFLIPLIVDFFIPGSGIVIELVFLIWELLEIEKTAEDDVKHCHPPEI